MAVGRGSPRLLGSFSSRVGAQLVRPHGTPLVINFTHFKRARGGIGRSSTVLLSDRCFVWASTIRPLMACRFVVLVHEASDEEGGDEPLVEAGSAGESVDGSDDSSEDGSRNPAETAVSLNEEAAYGVFYAKGDFQSIVTNTRQLERIRSHFKLSADLEL